MNFQNITQHRTPSETNNYVIENKTYYPWTKRNHTSRLYRNQTSYFSRECTKTIMVLFSLKLPSKFLTKNKRGIQIQYQRSVKYTISHRLYTDNDKLYDKIERELNHFLKLTDTFSDDAKMKSKVRLYLRLNLRLKMTCIIIWQYIKGTPQVIKQ